MSYIANTFYNQFGCTVRFRQVWPGPKQKAFMCLDLILDYEFSPSIYCPFVYNNYILKYEHI